jgi:uncharacterized membrane protein YobD (UPF0266 family)
MLLALVFSIVAYFAVNSGRWAPSGRIFVLLLAVSFLPLFLIYNVFLFPAAMDVVGIVVLNRMQRIPLYFFAAGLGVLAADTYLRRFGVSLNYRLASISAVVVAFCIAALRLSSPTVDHEVLWTKAFLPHLSRDSLVLADPLTSSDIASMTSATVLNIQFNGAVELHDLSREKAAVERFFGGDHEAARDIIKRYEPSHVVARAGGQGKRRERVQILSACKGYVRRSPL